MNAAEFSVSLSSMIRFKNNIKYTGSPEKDPIKHQIPVNVSIFSITVSISPMNVIHVSGTAASNAIYAGKVWLVG